ncbi:MAG TPA: hypothetical protein VHC18_24975 [Amycolatopsis sp.]|nr:hypothetical protein [Amycolatopsis sp.]
MVITCTPDLADDIEALGLSARPAEFEIEADLDPAKEDPLKLATAVEDAPADLVLLTPIHKERAAFLANRILREDGAGQVTQAIERLLAQRALR